MTETCDFLVIGGGIAGASAGYELAKHGRVILAEKESQPGYHTTGRSAALFAEGYGNAPIRALTRASRAFFENPPEGFTEAPLLTPRGAMIVATAEQMPILEKAYAETTATLPDVEWLDAAGVLRRAPVHGGWQDDTALGIGQRFAAPAAHGGDERIGGAQVDAHRQAALVRLGALTGFGDLQ
ncbi:FAD-dependent oxidoreductase [Hoeflea sp.]|uniref:FAD-dependent oxidoreductase n=1 Tax=Hoeflea sp. TaxID=1940281 RepID=UPI0025C14C77|nr:FAD-dependent oxidoreductase [Hoeflea sp.]